MTKKSLFTRVFHENEKQPLHVENSWLKREKKAGKADHVVASALRAFTITKATNSIFDLIFTLIKNPTKDIFLIPLNLIEIPIKVPTFHLFSAPHPSPTEMFDPFCGYDETWGNYAMQKGRFTAACYYQSPRLVTDYYLHFNSEN